MAAVPTFYERTIAFHKSESLTAPGFGCIVFALAPERCIGGGRGSHVRAFEEASIGGFVKDLAQGRDQDSQGASRRHHALSSVRRVMTNGVSLARASLRPLMTPTHWRADSISTSVTITRRSPVTAASRRLLKIRRAVALVAGPEARNLACARNPTRG